MKKLIICLALVMSVVSIRAQEIAGTWSGRAEIGAMYLRLAFHIERQGDGYTATMDSPDQGAMGIPVTTVTFAHDTLRLTVAPIRFFYTGVLRGDRIEGSFVQSKSLPLNLTRGEYVNNRPQEPRPPFPYRVEDVVFENSSAGINLAGTLTMPAEGRGFPAVVLLTGSGAQNRDEEIFGHKPFLVLADHLTRRGIAVLRFDDRGVGGSGGDPMTATSADFATDAAAALDYLRGRKEIDRTKTGLAGHSEGAAIAFIAAASHPEKVAFIVSMAGPGLGGREINKIQVRDLLAANGMSADSIASIEASEPRRVRLIDEQTNEHVMANIDGIAEELLPGFQAMSEAEKNQIRTGIIQRSLPWTRFFFAYDPAGDLKKIKCPVLAINGSKDIQVRSSVNLAAIRAALESGGNTDVTTTEYPGLNHLFQTAETGLMDEYGKIEETISPQVLDDMTDWILNSVIELWLGDGKAVSAR